MDVGLSFWVSRFTSALVGDPAMLPLSSYREYSSSLLDCIRRHVANHTDSIQHLSSLRDSGPYNAILMPAVPVSPEVTPVSRYQIATAVLEAQAQLSD